MTGRTEPVLRSRTITTPARSVDGDRWDAHVHAEHELLSSITGVVTVTTPDAVHVVPRGAAIWLPAGCEHAVNASRGNSMRCTWFAASVVSGALSRPSAMTTSTLLDGVLAHLDDCKSPDERRRAEDFALDLLSVHALPDEGLVQPSTPWLADVTSALAANPADDRTVQEWASIASVSVRTFSRRFASETGLSFSTWRGRLRMRAAMAHLSAGNGSAVVSRRVGFESPSAFTTAFHRATGISPRDFARGSRTM